MRFLRPPVRSTAFVLALALVACGGGGGGGSTTTGTDPQPPPATWQRTALMDVAAGGLTPARVTAAAGGDGRVHVALFEDAAPGPYRITYLAWDPAAAGAPEGETVVELDNAAGLAVAEAAGGRPVVVYQGGAERTCGDERQSDAMVSVRGDGGWAEYTAAIGENPRNPVFFDGVAGAGVAAAASADGAVHVAYQFYYEGCDAMNFAYPDLRYVRFDPDDPSALPEEEVVEGNVYHPDGSGEQNRAGDGVVLTVDADGVPSIFHYAELADGTQGLRVARRLGGQWVSEWIETDCEVGAIAAGPPGGEPGVAYLVTRYLDGRDDRGTLRYARWDGSGWAVETVDDTVRCAGACSLAFGPDAAVAIAYYEDETYAGRELKNLKLARFDGTSWTREVVSSTGDVGRYNGVWPDGAGGFAVLGYSDTDRAIYLFRAE